MPEAGARAEPRGQRPPRPPRKLRRGMRLMHARRRRLFADRAARGRYAPRLVPGSEREVKGWKAKAPTSAPGVVSEDPREKEPGQWIEIRLPERTVEVWRVARE